MDKALVAQVVEVAAQTVPVSTEQVTGLMKTMKRSRAVVKQMIEDAKDNFVEGAERYVQIHREATEAALASGDNEQALKGSQWAIQNISAEGARIIEKPSAEPTGTRIQIGVKIGGLNPAIVEGTTVE